MTRSITSPPANQTVTAGQRDQLHRFVSDALKKAGEEAIGELLASGTINKDAAQQVLGSGPKLKFGVIDLLRKMIPELAKLRLSCISLGKTITLKPTDGKRTIAKAKKVFDYIDGDFVGYGTDVPGEARGETGVTVHEMIEDSTFEQMFGSLSAPAGLDSLCLTQDQIIDFVENCRNWLCTDGYATFFLFKVGDKFFVADVGLGGDGLRVHVDHFSYDGVWGGGLRHRMVVPQLTSVSA